MASKNYSDSDLNDYFEAMSFQDQEEKSWQEYTDFLLSKLENVASSFRNQQIPIAIGAFGSSVEKLRIISPENIGDVDFMVFSLADETRITESIMEYSFPDDPVFVRLRGKDHPILQHCLAENSDYVASAALKVFHPKVFGDSEGFFNLLPKIFQKIQDIPSYEVACAVQSTPGPSIQWDFSQTRSSLHERIAEVKGYSDFEATDEIRGFLDWMAISLNPGKPFNEDHSAIIDETSKYFEETVRRIGVDPSIENYGNRLQELYTGPKIQELRMKCQELEIKAAAEKEKKEPRDTQKSAKQATEENEGSETEQNPGTGEAEACASQVEPKGFESTYDTESNVQESDDDLHRKKGFSEEISVESEQIHSGARELQGKGASEDAAKSAVQPGEGKDIDMAKMTEKKIKKHFIENVLQLGDAFKCQEELQEEYLQIAADKTRQKGGFDMVPAFLAKGWPRAARAWISRDRLWPNQDVIKSILDYGFHLVAKSPKESERPDLDFRLSFSHAELVLSKELNDIQRQCYRCFKSFHLTIIRNRKTKIFATYFLKTILFWAIEETGMDFWKSENRGSCVMMLLRKQLTALETKFLPHFFISEFNLLKDVAKEFPEEMEFLAHEVSKVCEDPMSYPNVSPEEGQDTKPAANLESMSKDPSAEEIGSCLTTAASGPPKNANLLPQEDVVSTENPFFPRFKDFQLLYRQVYREMLDLALTDEAVDAKDPTIKSIVTNLRKVMEKMESNPEKEMVVVLEHSLQGLYSSYIFHTGPTARDRIFSLLKGQCEMFAYVVRQEDLAPGNEHVIVNRMLDSSSDGSSDPFDLNVLYPGGSSTLANIFNVIGAQFEPTKQSTGIDDDIPLD